MSWWDLFKETWSYALEARKWWLVVFVSMLLGTGCLLAFAESSPVVPFLYPLF